MVQDANKLVVFGSQLLGVLIVAAGMLSQPAVLHTARPLGDKTEAVARPDSDGERFARLWDDPLENLPTFHTIPIGQSAATLSPTPLPQSQNGSTDIPGEGPNESLPGNKTPSRVADPGLTDERAAVPSSTPFDALPAPQHQARTTLDDAKTVCFWNIEDARPVAEAKENRLRIRYATISALATAGYLPLGESVLRPVVIHPVGEKAETTQGKDWLVGYFESFQAVDNGNPVQHVALIWTPKQSLPLAKIPTILPEVARLVTGNDLVEEGRHFHILHEGSSQDLIKYATAPLGPSAGGTMKMSVVFPRATIRSKDFTVKDSLRPIVTDDILARALVDELKLRLPLLNLHGHFHRPPPRVIIFTESDTNYSRAIELELKADLAETGARLEIYSYLRGLDGRPDDSHPSDISGSSKSQNAISNLLQGRAILETSFGTSQFDYLRRLALRLISREEGSFGADVCAVGILGSDIYDKMLVLQAVRPELPAAIFFTTDLNALYLERGNQSLTHNLVVASADGLDANEGSSNGWNLPPMRDSYQTVLAKYVRRVLAEEAGAPPAAAEPKRAKSFEIAGGRAVELLGTSGGIPEHLSSSILGCLANPLVNIGIFLAALINGFVILGAIFTRGKSSTNSRSALAPWARIFLYGEIFLAVLALIFLACVLSNRNMTLLFGEPLAFGISIWPSILVRLLAFTVAILLLLIASYSFTAYGIDDIDNLAKAVTSDEEGPPARSLWQELAGLCRFILFEKEPVAEKHQFPSFLAEFKSPKGRFRRIVIASLIYLVLSFLLFAMWPPSVPGRGAIPLLAEKIVLSLGVSLYIIHLMYCLDLHLSAYSLLRVLRSYYSPGVRNAFPALRLDDQELLTAVSSITLLIGRTLLYPLTVLILIILSRLEIFDAWVMTPSLTITFLFGALLLIGASLILWLEGARLKAAVLSAPYATPVTGSGIPADKRSGEDSGLREINQGVFAAWYNQPIFSAIFSALAVFGSLSVAEPVSRLFH